MLESAIFFSASHGDLDAIGRHYTQLQPFYNAFGSVLAASSDRTSVSALYLLSQLAFQPSRLAVFHGELELLEDIRDAPIVASVIDLERSLMEGALHRALERVKVVGEQLPAAGPVLALVVHSARDKAAQGIQAACASYPLDKLAVSLGLPAGEAEAFAKSRGWVVDSGVALIEDDEPAVEETPAAAVDSLVRIALQADRIL
jgi:hypothetical protein